MRRRGLLAVPALLASMAFAPAAQADDALKMYRVTVDEQGVGTLAELGVDIGHTGYDHSKKIAQTIFVDLIDQQAREARADGPGADRGHAGPARDARPRSPSGSRRRRRARAAALAKPETGGDSPNQFYDVYRTYSEPGGIKDEMTSLAAQYPGLAKLVVIGKTGQGQDIVALKVTKDARNVEGRRPPGDAVLGRQPRPRVDRGRGRPAHADVVARARRTCPEIADLLGRSELWFLPIQNPDGYDYTFTCGTGFRTANSQMCGATLVTDPADPLRGTYVYKTADGIIRAPNAAQPNTALRMPTQRLWRKTLRDNDGNGIFGDGQDGVDPNRNYPTAWGLDEEGASNSFSSGTYRGPFPLSEPEDLAYDRLLRRITPEAVINYHSAAQLLLYAFGYITDVSSDDDPWFKAITGTDGDAAVDPYISQRSSDLYITNGETTDHAYNKYGVDVVDARARRVRDRGRRHVLLRRLRLHLPGQREHGRGRLREEPRLRAQRRGDDARPRPSGPPAQRHGGRDAVPDQGLARHRAEPVQRLLRRHPDARGHHAPHPRRRPTTSSRSQSARAAARARSRSRARSQGR